jgi:hypothetical protein
LYYIPNLEEITILVYPPAPRIVEGIIFGSLRWAPYGSDGRPQLLGLRKFVQKSWRDRAAKVILEETSGGLQRNCFGHIKGEDDQLYGS